MIDPDWHQKWSNCGGAGGDRNTSAGAARLRGRHRLNVQGLSLLLSLSLSLKLLSHPHSHSLSQSHSNSLTRSRSCFHSFSLLAQCFELLSLKESLSASLPLCICLPLSLSVSLICTISFSNNNNNKFLSYTCSGFLPFFLPSSFLFSVTLSLSHHVGLAFQLKLMALCHFSPFYTSFSCSIRRGSCSPTTQTTGSLPARPCGTRTLSSCGRRCGYHVA